MSTFHNFEHIAPYATDIAVHNGNRSALPVPPVNENFLLLTVTCVWMLMMTLKKTKADEEITMLKEELEMAHEHQKVLERDLNTAFEVTRLILEKEEVEDEEAQDEEAQQEREPDLIILVESILSKKGLTAAEIAQKIAVNYPYITKRDVNPCLYKLKIGRKAKPISIVGSSPKWYAV